MSKPGCHFCSGNSDGAGLYTAVAASGLKAARARIGLRHGTLEPVAPMLREKPKRQPRKGLSTDAEHRDGSARSSDERPVTGRERRSRVIPFSVPRPTAAAGGAHG